MLFTTYILFSHSSKRFYTGSSKNLERRLSEHNSGQNKSTRTGIPWKIVFTLSFPSHAESLKKELEIKKRGAKRFLADLQIIVG